MRHRALIAALLAVPSAALGHGTAPAALEVISVRDGRPDVVRLNFGLAVRISGDSEHFRYVCPRQWEEYNYVPAIGVLADGGLVVGRFEGPWAGDAEGCGFAAMDAPEWSQQTFIAQAGRDPLWMVTRDDGGSTIWRVSAAPAIELAERLPDVKLDSIWVTDAGWRALGARPEPRLFTHGPGGTTFQPLALPEPPQFLGLRWVDPEAPDHLLFAVNVEQGIRLYETVDGGATVHLALSAAERLHGPVRLGGALVALADGVWQVRAGEAFEAGPSVAYTCLHAVGGQVYACRNRDLVALSGDPGSPEVATAFELSSILAPEPACPGEPDTARACAEQWLHFGAEAGLARQDAGPAGDDAGPGGADAGVVPPAEPGGGGCQGLPRPARTSSAALLGALLLARARRRGHPSQARPGSSKLRPFFRTWTRGGAARDDQGSGQR